MLGFVRLFTFLIITIIWFNLFSKDSLDATLSLAEEYHSDFQHLYINDRLAGNYSTFSSLVTKGNLSILYLPFETQSLSLEYNSNVYFVSKDNVFSGLDSTATVGTNLLSPTESFFIDIFLSYHFVFENFNHVELLYSDISGEINLSFDNGGYIVPSFDFKYLRYINPSTLVSHLNGSAILLEPGLTFYSKLFSNDFSCYLAGLLELDLLRDQIAYMLNKGKVYIENSYLKTGSILVINYNFYDFLITSKFNYYYFYFLNDDYLVANGAPKGRRKDHFINLTESISYIYNPFSISFYYKLEKLISNYSNNQDSYINYGFNNNILGIEISFGY